MEGRGEKVPEKVSRVVGRGVKIQNLNFEFFERNCSLLPRTPLWWETSENFLSCHPSSTQLELELQEFKKQHDTKTKTTEVMSHITTTIRNCRFVSTYIVLSIISPGTWQPLKLSSTKPCRQLVRPELQRLADLLH